MNEALVEDAEDHERRKDSGQDQHALPAQGLLEHLRRAGEAGGDGGRQIRGLLDRGDLVHRIAKRIVRREVEGDRHRGLLPLMIDLQRADGRYKFRNRIERDGLVVRGLQVELGQV